ncbi:peptidase M24, structural domain-containing protein, partial [Roridomyces roridus]
MRPAYPLSSKRKIPDHIQRPDYATDGIPKSEKKAYASPPEMHGPEVIEKLRTVCRMSREILDLAAAALRPGITTDEIDEIVRNATIERNAYPSTLNYRNYPKSLCTSVNEVVCHGIPDQTCLKEGDIINLDISVYYQGYHMEPIQLARSTTNRRNLFVPRECLDKAIALCRPGALIRDLGKTMSVRTYTGHGINTSFHSPPDIPHYAK